MKRITIRLSEEDEKFISKLEGETVSDKIKTAIRQPQLDLPDSAKELIEDKIALGEVLELWRKMKLGVKIPKNKWTKSEMAEFLGITQLDKDWVLFMDKIDKIYYE